MKKTHPPTELPVFHAFGALIEGIYGRGRRRAGGSRQR